MQNCKVILGYRLIWGNQKEFTINNPESQKYLISDEAKFAAIRAAKIPVDPRQVTSVCIRRDFNKKLLPWIDKMVGRCGYL